MDFQSATQCQAFRDEVTAFGTQSNYSILQGFPFHTISSFDDLSKYLAKNHLLGDDGGAVLLRGDTSTTAAAGTSTATTTDEAALALQRYMQLHTLTWPNAVVRCVIPKSKIPTLVDVNKELTAARNAAGGAASVYRVGVVRRVHFALPAKPTGGDAAAASRGGNAPTGPSDSLAGFVSDYLMKMLYFTIDFGDCVDEKFGVKFISNDTITAEEFATLTTAVVDGAKGGKGSSVIAAAGGSRGNTADAAIFTNPTFALQYYFREDAATTQMRLYSVRLSGGGASSSSSAASGAPARKYPNSLVRGFVATEPLKTFGSLHLTRAVQQLMAIEGIDGGVTAAGEDEEDDTTCAEDIPLTRSELAVILNAIVAPQLERLNALLIEQECYGSNGAGASSSSSAGGASNNNMAQLEESRRELYGIQQSLKESNGRNSQLQADVDKLTKDLQAANTNVKKLLTTNTDLLNTIKTARQRAADNQRLLTETKSMLKMNENAGPEEVLQALRRKLGQ